MKKAKSEKEEILERYGVEDDNELTGFPIGDMIGGVLTNAIKNVTDSELEEEAEEDKLRK